MARSPEQGSDENKKMLLGQLPGGNGKRSKAPVQQRHTYALWGMQRISREGYFPLQQLCDGCASKLPLALLHLPSQQGIRIDDGNKLIYLN